MADATFDYVNLIITLPLGQTEVDVERDLYSAWKRSQQANDEPETGAHPPSVRSVVTLSPPASTLARTSLFAMIWAGALSPLKRTPRSLLLVTSRPKTVQSTF
jgi:hypothetical protein